MQKLWFYVYKIKKVWCSTKKLHVLQWAAAHLLRKNGLEDSYHVDWSSKFPTVFGFIPITCWHNWRAIEAENNEIHFTNVSHLIPDS